MGFVRQRRAERATCLGGQTDILQVALLEALAQIEAPAELLRVLHRRRRDAREVEHLDAGELVDAHLAEERLDGLLVRAVRERLRVDQRVEPTGIQRPVAALLRVLGAQIEHEKS